MATATKTTKEIKPAQPAVVEERVTLIMSKEEAQVLADLFSMVGGHPKQTRRGLVDNLRKALLDVGFNYNKGEGGIRTASDIMVQGQSLWFT